VITGGKRHVLTPQAQRKRLVKQFWPLVRNRLLKYPYHSAGKLLKAEKDEEETKYFSGSKVRFEQQHNDLLLAEVGEPHRSLNTKHYLRLIRDAKPDLIVIMGTTLVRKGIIESAPLVLNIHTGLSPYYRGGYTNLWPIIEGDHGYFGVTVHVISPGIDSGDIIYTAQPEISANDNFSRVNCKCIQLGTDLMLQAIEHAGKNSLRSVPQWTKGKLFLDRDMNSLVAHRYLKLREQFFTDEVRLREAGSLPKLRLIDNGQDRQC
jgi:folate-dependent phosphoribosylglycinamide formyltransferase PurN